VLPAYYHDDLFMMIFSDEQKVHLLGKWAVSSAGQHQF
jgi:hypothetical protein